MRGELEDEPATGLHDPQELVEVATGEIGLHVLEGDVSEGERDRPVGNHREVGRLVE